MVEHLDKDDDLYSYSAMRGSLALPWRGVTRSGGEPSLALPKKRYFLFYCLSIDCLGQFFRLLGDFGVCARTPPSRSLLFTIPWSLYASILPSVFLKSDNFYEH